MKQQIKPKIKIPIEIKLSYFWYFLNAALALIASLMFFFRINLVNYFFETPSGFMTSWWSILTGLILFGGAVLSFFIARGLLKRKKWAKNLAIFFGLIGIIRLDVIGFIIAIYLLVGKKAKEFFI